MLPHRSSWHPRRAVGAATALLVVVLASAAQATDISLTFGSLPSAQGWTFTTGGSPTATEAQSFSVSGGVLTLNTMAFGFTQGATMFQIGITPTQIRNANGTIPSTAYQGQPTRITNGTWGRIKSLYR